MEALASASGKLGREDAESVMAGIRDTCGLSSDARAADIAADVLEKLLPDETVKLPEVECVGGGVAYRALKRAFDVCACALALVVMAIPMLVIAARIRRESPALPYTRRSARGWAAGRSSCTSSAACTPMPKNAVHGGRQAETRA